MNEGISHSKTEDKRSNNYIKHHVKIQDKAKIKGLKRSKAKSHAKSGFILDGIKQSHYGIPEFYVKLDSIFYSKQIRDRNTSVQSKKQSFIQTKDQPNSPKNDKQLKLNSRSKVKLKFNKKLFALMNYQSEMMSKLGKKNSAFLKHNLQVSKLPNLDNPYLLPAIEQFRNYKQFKTLKLSKNNSVINSRSVSKIRSSKIRSNLEQGSKTVDSKSNKDLSVTD